MKFPDRVAFNSFQFKKCTTNVFHFEKTEKKIFCIETDIACSQSVNIADRH